MVRSKTILSKLFDVSLVIILVLVALLCLAPILHTVAVSFSDKSAAAAGQVTLFPVGFNLTSYKTILADKEFLNSFIVSLERVLLGASINFFLTVLMAYPLSKASLEFRGRNAYMWFLVFTMLFNGGLIPWYLTIRSLNLLDTIWALVLPGAVPVFSVILVMNFFRSVPKELDEAGVMDGAGPWYMLFAVYLPLSVPSLATVTLFSIVGHWNSFFDGLILMNKPENYPLQTYIQQLVIQIKTESLDIDQIKLLDKISNQTLQSAKVFVSMVPVLIVYPFLQRYFISGIMLGSVKE